MSKDQISKVQKFFEARIQDLKKELENLENYLKIEELNKQIKLIDDEWKSVVENHPAPLKLIILAEAPLKYEKYFYKNQATFLDSLRSHWELDSNANLPAKMIEKGVLLLDIYKYPLPSQFYKKDEGDVLYDDNYVSSKINILKSYNLINDSTHFVFRYKQLFNKKKLQANDSLKKLIYIKDKNGEFVSFNQKEKPQVINDVVKVYLIKYCS